MVVIAQHKNDNMEHSQRVKVGGKRANRTLSEPRFVAVQTPTFRNKRQLSSGIEKGKIKKNGSIGTYITEHSKQQKQRPKQQSQSPRQLRPSRFWRVC